MSWNYRLIIHDDGELENQWIGLHEVYYDDQGYVTFWTLGPVEFVTTLDEGQDSIVESLRMALRDASEKEMLIESELRKLVQD